MAVPASARLMATRPLELRYPPFTMDVLEAQWDGGVEKRSWETPLKYAQFANPDYLAPDHIQRLSELLTAAANEGNARILVLMPPRHGKSEMCSHYFPAWYLLHHPNQPIILASYEADFAARWGRKVRTEIQIHGHERGVYLRGDSGAASRWETTHGGEMVTSGVGGPITGRGAKMLVIDDPVKNAEEAESPTYRERTWEWFLSTAYTRLEPGGSIIVIMTHWDQDDLAGRLLGEGVADKWTTIKLPAIAEEDDPIGRVPGEALWPDRFPLERLNQIRATLGGHWWSALYQQRPTAREGGLFQWAWIHYVSDEELPQLQRVVIGVDPAGSTKKNSDETGICVAGLGHDGHYYVLYCGGYKTSPGAWARKVWELYDVWQADKVVVEVNFGGDMVDANLRTVRAQGPIKMVTASRGKQLRADPIASLYEQGRVHHFRVQPSLEEQMTAFPNALHDDLVDAMVYALTELSVGGYEGDTGGFGPGASAPISPW